MGVKNLINLIKTMEKNMKMPLNLKECGVDTHKVAESLENIAESAFADACTPTNPRIPTKEDIMRIVEKVKE